MIRKGTRDPRIVQNLRKDIKLTNLYQFFNRKTKETLLIALQLNCGP